MAKPTVWIAVATLLLGCGDIDRNVDKASETAKQVSKDVSQALSKVAEVDPLLLQSLYKDNKQAREDLERFRAKVSSVGDQGQGISVSDTTHLYVEVVSFSGKLEVSAWVDDRATNEFVTKKLLTGDLVRPNFAHKFAGAALYRVGNEEWKRQGGKEMDGFLWRPDVLDADSLQNLRWTQIRPAAQAFLSRVPAIGAEIDQSYENAFGEAWTQGMMAPTLTGASQIEKTFLDSRVGSGALAHRVFLEVRPIEYDKTGQWQISVNVYLQTPIGEKQTVAQAQVKSSDFQDRALGKALESKQIAVFSTRGGAKSSGTGK